MTDGTQPYPSPESLARYPFKSHPFVELPEAEMLSRAHLFYQEMQQRRSARVFSDRPVPRELIELAIATAGTAPSGAHLQPWKFALIGDPDVKRQIRDAAEAEERQNYEGGRMNDEWQAALAPLGTHSNKQYLERAPWIVVVFEERFHVLPDGSKRHNYYVKESVGIACGFFIAALHHMGLTTLTHTPSPMKFLSHLLHRGDNERPSILFPIGYPEPDSLVPDLGRKPLEEILVNIP
ncbi:MAG: nitroreductase family protein [Acidimicrobiia bacterium]|nr:nitroreductase family protein [Acidimicrobiia bacterium]